MVKQGLCVLFLRAALLARQDRLQKRLEVCVPSADRGKQEWQQRTTFLSTREQGCSQRTRVLPGTQDWRHSITTENKGALRDKGRLTAENKGAPGMKDNIP